MVISVKNQKFFQPRVFNAPLRECLLSIAVACATTRLSTHLLAWSAVPAQVWIRAGAWN